MIITKVDVMKVKTSMSNGHWSPIVCRIYTDEGIYGDGEAALAYGSAQTAAFGMVQNFAKLVIGMNPLDTEIIWDKLYRTTFWGQNGGPVIFAGISAIDIALWDIKGKYFGVPIYQLLGGKRRDRLRCYASQLQIGWSEQGAPQRTPEEYARASRKAVDEGYDAIKIDFFTFKPEGGVYTDLDRIGLLPPHLMRMFEERVKAVRDEIGPDVDLIVENHSQIDAQSAVQIGNMIKKYNIFYYEEPTTPSVQLSKYVHDETGLPVANGERIYSRWQYLEYFKENAIQVIQPDIGNCGGITEVKKVCDMAYTFDVNVQIHVCGSPLSTAAALQLECTIPNFIIHEHHVHALAPENRKLCIHDYQPENGRYSIPDLPGLGQELSPCAFQNCEMVTIEGEATPWL